MNLSLFLAGLSIGAAIGGVALVVRSWRVERFQRRLP